MGYHKSHREQEDREQEIHQRTGTKYQQSGANAFAGQTPGHLWVFFTGHFDKSTQRYHIKRIACFTSLYRYQARWETNAKLLYLYPGSFGGNKVPELMSYNQHHQNTEERHYRNKNKH